MERIERVTKENYRLYDAMVRRRMRLEDTTGRQPTEAVENELADPNLRVYVFRVEDRFVGWISLVYIPKVGKFDGHGHIYVDELYVEPEHQRKGYAKALMQTASVWAQEKKATGVRLYVNVENPGAKLLYEGCGFEEQGTAYFMEK